MNTKTKTLRPRSKDEIAQALGISRTTLTRWVKPIEHLLTPLGYKQQKILTPAMLHIIYSHLCIHEDIFDCPPNHLPYRTSPSYQALSC